MFADFVTEHAEELKGGASIDLFGTQLHMLCAVCQVLTVLTAVHCKVNHTKNHTAFAMTCTMQC